MLNKPSKKTIFAKSLPLLDELKIITFISNFELYLSFEIFLGGDFCRDLSWPHDWPF